VVEGLVIAEFECGMGIVGGGSGWENINSV
jgi:hypothetical protein